MSRDAWGMLQFLSQSSSKQGATKPSSSSMSSSSSGLGGMRPRVRVTPSPSPSHVVQARSEKQAVTTVPAHALPTRSPDQHSSKLLLFLADVSSKPQELEDEVAKRRRDMEKKLEIVSLVWQSHSLKCMDESLSMAPEEAYGMSESPEESCRILKCESFAVRL